jgi:hypothetical protein
MSRHIPLTRDRSTVVHILIWYEIIATVLRESTISLKSLYEIRKHCDV